jgi:OOP family OmpA-OmpF porin
MNLANRILLASVLVASSALSPVRALEKTAIEYRTGPLTEPVGESFDVRNKVPAPLSRITLYRTENGSGTGATGVEVNGRYHTSLQLGSFSQLCFSAPTNVTLSVRLIHTGDAVKNYAEATDSIQLRQTQEVYVRVADMGNERASLQVVDAKTAQRELRQTRRQSHAVSRVAAAASCQPPEGVTAKPIMPTNQIETITLGADTLFKFGKSDIDSILPMGSTSLDALLTSLKNRYGSLDQVRIHLVGYADPLGTSATNQRISTERAQTIQDYLIQAGVASQNVSSEGRGDNALIVTDCPRMATPQSIACNKPNRRVVVNVSTPIR